jgi:hypothetical protein
MEPWSDLAARTAATGAACRDARGLPSGTRAVNPRHCAAPDSNVRCWPLAAVSPRSSQYGRYRRCFGTKYSFGQPLIAALAAPTYRGTRVVPIEPGAEKTYGGLLCGSQTKGGALARPAFLVVSIQMAATSAASSLPPEILETRRRQRGVFHRVLDVLMAEIVLNRPRVPALIRKLVAAGMAKHCG